MWMIDFVYFIHCLWLISSRRFWRLLEHRGKNSYTYDSLVTLLRKFTLFSNTFWWLWWPFLCIWFHHLDHLFLQKDPKIPKLEGGKTNYKHTSLALKRWKFFQSLIRSRHNFLMVKVNSICNNICIIGCISVPPQA